MSQRPIYFTTDDARGWSGILMLMLGMVVFGAVHEWLGGFLIFVAAMIFARHLFVLLDWSERERRRRWENS